MSGQREIKNNSNSNSLLGQSNLRRCFYSALASVAFFPMLLLLYFAEPEITRYYLIPGTFYAVVSAAFAYLFYQMLQRKAKQYYSAVIWTYLLLLQLFFSYFAIQNIWFYFAVVVLSAYIVLLPARQYVILALGELACYAALVMKSGVEHVTISQLVGLLAVHLFALVLSGDLYAIKKNYLAEEKKLRKETKLSEEDELTGLFNRRGLERRVSELWPFCVKQQETVAVLVLEIDSFKAYNDRYGHAQGDVCIRRVASTVAEAIKGHGTVARIGGAQFLVFVHGMEIQKIYDLAECIRIKIENLHIAMGTSETLTASIGLDIRYASEEVYLQGLYGRAADGLYEAKQAGRNCVRSAHRMKERRSKIG